MSRREELAQVAQTNPSGLVEQCLGLEEQLSQLRAERETLRLEQAALWRQNTELLASQQALWSHEQELLAKQRELLAEQQALRRQQKEMAEEIAELKRLLFGPKAEKLSPEQEEQLQELAGDLRDQAARSEPLSADLLEEEKPAPPRVRRRRHPFPLHLEKQTIVLEPEDKVCPRCGPKRRIGQECTREYDLIAAKMICKETIRPKYACACPDCQPSIAPLPPRLLPQSHLGLGLAVYILLSRFDDHVSYYKLEQNFRERFGLLIPRQQMVQWVEKIAFLLLAIYELMWQEMKASGYLQIDETPVKVLDPEVQGKAATGFLWFYAVPKGDVLIEFSPSRGQAAPKKRLAGFGGTIQADGYEVYPCLERDLPGIQRNGCLAHARRRFYKAVQDRSPGAIWFIAQLRILYRIEDESRDLEPPQRLQHRHAQGAPGLLAAMKTKALELQPKELPQSSLGKALSYFVNEYDAIIGYLRDGRFEIDNNLVENAIRPVAVGRKRWLFIGHPQAGWRSAVIYSIIGSCRRRGINPQTYLADVLARLPAMKISEVKDLVPGRWKPAAADSS